MTTTAQPKPAHNAVRFSPNKSARGAFKVKFICIHWSGGNYSGGEDWIMDDASNVSYHEFIGPTEGQFRQLVPANFAAWSVGVSKSFDPRIAFKQGNKESYNIALAGGPPVAPTAYQLRVLVERTAVAMKSYGWNAEEIWRIVPHSAVAVFPAGHKRAGQLGRKSDPDGSGWLDMNRLRTEVAKRLR